MRRGMQDFGPVNSEETQNRFDVGAAAARISRERERNGFRDRLRRMSAIELAGLLRDAVCMLDEDQAKIIDLLQAAADRLGEFIHASE